MTSPDQVPYVPGAAQEPFTLAQLTTSTAAQPAALALASLAAPQAVSNAQAAGLNAAIAVNVQAGWRLETASPPHMAQLVSGSRPNHVLHLLLTLVTFGLWAIVWLIIAMQEDGEKRILIYSDEHGTITYYPGR
jgi:hypothetical protein